jgi:hypothetical protein
MSTRPRAKQGPQGSSDGQAVPLPIGLDPEYSDCVIKASSGKVYHTSLGVIVSCSPVFRDLVHSCGKQSSSDEVGEVQGSGKKRKPSRTKAVLEIPLPDPEQQIKTLVEHLHQPDRFFASVVPNVTKKGAAKILQLAPIAFKYDMQGKKTHLVVSENLLVIQLSSEISDMRLCSCHDVVSSWYNNTISQDFTSMIIQRID